MNAREWMAQQYPANPVDEPAPKAEEKFDDIYLTYCGGGRVYYSERGVKEVSCHANSMEHFDLMIEKAKVNAQELKKLLVVVNPRGTHNPYEGGCPKDKYDYR